MSAQDVDGDGHPNFVTGGFWGGNLRWRQHPGKPCGKWQEHVWAEHVIAADTGNIETTTATSRCR